MGNVIVLSILAAAVFFSVRSLLKSRKSGCCGSCSGCRGCAHSGCCSGCGESK